MLLASGTFGPTARKQGRPEWAGRPESLALRV